MSFGSRLKELRISKGISQLELARFLNLSANTISQYETGKRFPDQNGIVTICRYFNISSDYLLGLSDQKRPSDETHGHLYINLEQQNAIYDLILAFKNNEGQLW